MFRGPHIIGPSDLHPQNAAYPISTTDEGMEMDLRDGHSLNAYSLMVSMPSGSTTLPRFSQPLKQVYGITFSFEPASISTLERFVHLLNASD